MNDKIIINAISKAYFIITSFLLFILISLSAVFIILQNGLYIEDISVPNLKIKQLYIKWNENLDISIKEIEIVQNKHEESSKFNLDGLSSLLKKIPHYYDIFEKVTINKVVFNDITSSFSYTKGENGFIIVNSPRLSLSSDLSFETNLLHFKIKKLKDKNRDITLNGDIILDIENKDVTGSLFVNIHNDIYVDLLLFVNQKKLFYKLNLLKEIKDISYVIQLLDLDKELQYWAYEAIGFSDLSIKNLHGWLDFKNLDDAYKNIYVSATGHNLTYAYNKELDSIHTKKTDLVFENGVLFIYPRRAYTYKSQLGESWLKIDFTQKEELLTLKLLFDGKLDKDTLSILEKYKIKIPFLQNTGKTKTDLTLKVNLRTIAVDAKGNFDTNKANFNYLGYNIDISNAHIVLNNYKVNIKDMYAKYNDNIETKVDVTFNAENSIGKINFNINKIKIDDINLSFDTNKTNLQAQYIISPKKDFIVVNNSLWNYKDYKINIDKLRLPFDLNKKIVNIPNTLVSLDHLAKASVSGHIDLNKLIFDLDIQPKEIIFKDIRLADANTSIKVKYDKFLNIANKEKIHFYFKERASFLNPSNIQIKDNVLKVEETYLNVEDIFKAKFSIDYSFDTKKGYLQTRRSRITTNNLGLLYFNKSKTKFDIHTNKEGELSIKSKDLKISYLQDSSGWRLNVPSMFLISLNSAFLKRYHLKNGNISFWQDKDDKEIQFSSNIKYDHKLVVKNNFEYEDYLINGTIDIATKNAHFNVNNDIDVNINETIEINVNNVGLNINAFVDLVNSLDIEEGGTNDAESSTNNLKVSVQANNSHLYISENRHIISDEMYLYYNKHILTAGLLYKEGVAGLKYENNHFDAYGEKFNDAFMEQLFAMSEFENGHLKFNLSGNTKKYDGVFTIEDTTIMEYKVLNNVLAFVNTIPSLVTFSLPSYDADGLKVETAYMKLTSKDDNLYFSDIYLSSKELTITGRGEASIKYNKIDTELNLKTDLGSKASQIPLLGHIIMGKDSISTTLQVTGALDNPEINSLIAKDIAVAPLNILLRAVTLPYYLIESMDLNSSEDTKGIE